ncbi:MAG: flagellar hook-associated protein 3 [Armatimonadetes bacterium]|nr:flagellar hook-associated protein 3 [Armatimonadota bacterium]
MRVTNGMQFLSSIRQIGDSTGALFKTRQEVSSGKRIQSGADDPAGYTRLLQIRSAQADADRFSSISKQVKSSLQTYDNSLDGITDVMRRARVLALQGASDFSDAGQRQVLSDQVNTLLEEAIDAGNNFTDGKFIYGGSNNATAPFSVVRDPVSGKITNVNYGGDDREQSVDLEPGVSMGFTLSGTEVFGDPPGDPGNFMGALIKLRDDIATGNNAIISASVATLDAINDRFLSLRGEMGVRIQHLDNLTAFREQTLFQLEEERAAIEDTDLAQAMTRLSLQEVTYQGALTVAARLNRDTLLDRLR